MRLSLLVPGPSNQQQRGVDHVLHVYAGQEYLGR